jgi:uncharacterized membrane protein
MKKSLLPLLAWAAAVAALVLYVLWLGPVLPPRVASHFGIGGQANGWTLRSHYLALYLGAAAAAELLMVGLGFALPLLPRGALNVPHPEYWRSAEHFGEACAVVRNFFCWMGALMALWFAALHGLLARANRVNPPHLDGWALGALVALYACLLVLLILRLQRSFRRGPSAASP